MEPRGRPVRAEGVTVVGNGVVVVGGRAARQRMAADGTDVVPVAVRGVTAAEEFIAFVTAAKDPLYRMAFLLCGDHHRAEELTQQTFEKTWRSWRSAREGDPLAYARRILANQRIDTWRRTRREVLTGLDHDDRDRVADHADAIGDREAVVRALLQLPLKQRRVVVLRHLLELSEAEVAAELDMPVGTVKSSAARGLRRLRELLSPGRSEEE